MVVPGNERTLPNLRQMKQFVAAVEEPSLATAAQALFISQQALSAALRSLEKDLGAQLFDRSGRNLQLTAAGRRLYAAAPALLHAAAKLASDTRQAATGTVAPFVIGHSPAISGEEVYRVIEPLVDGDPALRITARMIFPGDIRDALFDSKIDMALRRGVTTPDDLATTILTYQPLRLAVSVDHPLADKERVAMTDIAEQPIVVWAPEHQSFYTDFLVSQCRRAGFEPNITVNPIQGMPPVTAVVGHLDLCVFVTDDAGPAYRGEVVVIDFDNPSLVPMQALWAPHTTSEVRSRLLRHYA